MPDSVLRPLCTKDNYIRSNYYSDSFRARFSVEGVTRLWDISRVTIPFSKQNELYVMDRFGIEQSDLQKFYDDFFICVKNEIIISKHLTDQEAQSVVRLVSAEILNTDNGGHEVYMVTEPLNTFVESDFLKDGEASLLTIISIGARFSQTLKGISQVGVHIGAIDLDCIYLTETENKTLITLGGFLYAAKDSYPSTLPKPKTVPLTAHESVKSGGNPTLATDMFALSALLWTMLSGNHYSVAPNFDIEPKYASPEVLEVLKLGMSMDENHLKEMNKSLHGIMKKIKNGLIPNDIIRFPKPPVSLDDYGASDSGKQEAFEAVAEYVDGESDGLNSKAQTNEIVAAKEESEPPGDNAYPSAMQGEESAQTDVQDDSTSSVPNVVPEPEAALIQEPDAPLPEELQRQEASSTIDSETSHKEIIDSEPIFEFQLMTEEILFVEPEKTESGESGSAAEDECKKHSGKAPRKPLRKKVVAAVVIIVTIAAIGLIGYQYIYPLPQVQALLGTMTAHQPNDAENEPGVGDSGSASPSPTVGARVAFSDEPYKAPSASDKSPDPTPSDTDSKDTQGTNKPSTQAKPEQSSKPVVPPSTQPKPVQTETPAKPEQSDPPEQTAKPEATTPPVQPVTPPPSATSPPDTPDDSDSHSFENDLVVRPASATVAVGETVQLKPSVSCVWSSSNLNVATVKGGYVTGVAEGTCTIKAKASGQTFTVTITVK